MSHALPWESLSEHQQTCRLDRVLFTLGDYIYVTARDSYRAVDAEDGSPDFCPASALETRRRFVDQRASGLLSSHHDTGAAK